MQTEYGAAIERLQQEAEAYMTEIQDLRGRIEPLERLLDGVKIKIDAMRWGYELGVSEAQGAASQARVMRARRGNGAEDAKPRQPQQRAAKRDIRGLVRDVMADGKEWTARQLGKQIGVTTRAAESALAFWGAASHLDYNEMTGGSRWRDLPDVEPALEYQEDEPFRLDTESPRGAL